MDEAAAVVLEEEGEKNVVCEHDGVYGDNEASAGNPNKGDGVFCCQKCGEAFREEVAYLNHLQHHSKGDNSSCLENQHDDKYEDETHHDPALHDFHSHLDAEGLSTSQDSAVEMDSGTKQQTFRCEECGKSYGILGHLLNHKRSHKQASKSVFHDLEHLKKKSFQCEFCGRSYSRATALDAHRRCHEEKLVKRSRSTAESFSGEQKGDDIKIIENHTEEAEKTDIEKNFVCSCGKSFATRHRLKTHQRFNRKSLCSPEIFEKQKKSGDFQCSHCDKTFSGQIALINHERWHSHDVPENKFPCEECGKVFMTLAFYYRHQRIAHSKETPSKSFLHQVCQLQKKSFECKDCGLKFSRASALHSHELHHTDVFKETEKGTLNSATLLPQQNLEKIIKCENKVAESIDVFENPFSTTVGNHYVKDTEDDIEIFEPGDLIVKVISSSDSEDDSEQDGNSDLELLCESDHDIKEEGDMALRQTVVSKPDLDLKIVQVDYGEPLPTVVEREWDNISTEERFDCPDCYRWFTNPASLRVHRMWHGVRKRRQLAQGQSVTMYPLDLSCREKVLKIQQSPDSDNTTTSPQATNRFNHVEICSSQKRENYSVEKREYNPKKTLLGPKLYHCEQCGKGFWSLGAFSHHKQSPMQCTDVRLRKGFGGSFTNGHSRSSFKVTCPVCGRKFRHRGTMALHMRKHENGNHKCELCNRSFRLLSGLLRHRSVHNSQIQPPPVKSFQYQVEQLQKNTYSCPDCGKLFSRAKALQFHMKSHGYETGYSPPSHRSTDTVEDLQCPSCLAHFNKKSSLRAHKKLCTKKESKAEPLENSVIDVNKITKKKNNQLSDKKLENKSHDLKYKCKVCDRSFSVVGALNFHKRIHTERHKALAKAKALVKKSKLEESNKGLFSCLDCGRRFVSNSALGSHKRWHRDKPCSKSSLEEDELNSTKTEVGPFKCNKCDKKFFNLRVLQRHQMFNAQCQNTERALDEDVTVENKSLGEHAVFSCTECGQTFEQGSLLDVHVKNVHGKHFIVYTEDELGSPVDQVQKQVGEKPSQTRKSGKLHCPVCSMSFVNVRGVRAHKWQAHSKKRKRGKKSNHKVKKDVIVPKKNASVKNTDSDAMKTSHINVESKPTDNGNAFDQTTAINNSESEFDSHSASVAHEKAEEETHTNEIEIISPTLQLSELASKCLYKCDKCGKAFSTPEQLGNHKTKAKSRPFCCALCCSGFWTENQLQQHFIWHDKIRGRLPNELRFRINAASSMTHQTAHVFSPNKGDSTLIDPLVIPDDKAQCSHKCQNCGEDFLTQTALQKHKRQFCNTGSYHCSACPRTFREIQELIDHHQECTGGSSRDRGASAAVRSGDNSLTCLECGATFFQKNDLHQHYIEHARCVYVTHNTDKN